MDDRGRTHHERPVHETVLFLETDAHRGLTGHEAARRLERFGPNVLPPNARHGPLVRFLLQFHNPLVYVLLGAALVTLSIGHLVDTAVILGVVVVNAGLGYVQERRAGEALEGLAEYTRTQSTVVRDGRPQRADSRVLVPGDVVLLSAGEKVPADVRLTAARGLRIDESALTGESVPVDKLDALVPPGASLGDRSNMAYSSTLVTAGSGRGIVVGTGVETEIGRIHQLVGQAAGVQTPLTRKLTRFSQWLTGVILLLAALTFMVGIARGESAADMVTAAVALAVGAIPEGLPAAVTITLAIGVSRMARRNAVIRRLPAAETLGSTTVICTDKTGTLTQNRMTVRQVYADGRVHDVPGTGSDAVNDCLVAGVLCNDAALASASGGQPVGDPTEVALLAAAGAQGIHADEWTAKWPRIDEIPFDSDRRFMATLHDIPDAAANVVVVKGATEEVIGLCGCQRSAGGRDEPLDRAAVEEPLTDFGDRALRVIAFASGPAPKAWSFQDERLPDSPLTFLGLQAMEDPPRPESIRAVAACHRAGIAVKMITGDHARTAQAIARQIGLGHAAHGDPTVMTGDQMADLGIDRLAERIADVDVFARVSAEQKLRLVEALQHTGHVVAMTGDGINDAPALKQADIGIAMGQGGTEVAKEAAAMVLVDDNFASIEAAVEEGRSVFDNLTKFVAWTLPTNLGEGLVVLAAIVTGAALPITPVQILWINMTTAVALGLMLAFEPAEDGIMDRPPRPPRQPILTATLVRRILLVGALMLVGAFGAFELTLAAGGSIEAARTVAVNAFVAMEIGYLFNCRALDRSVLSVGLFSNRLLLAGVAITVILQLAFTYAPFMNVAFQSEPIPAVAWAPVLALGAAVYAFVGLEKWFSARPRRRDRVDRNPLAIARGCGTIVPR
ncbi:MAG: HAD-IC family P-type ATPase [Actinomycetota bacterium]|nr:HAD-IC family P-type ATPase [Actinomycetota bacterium]